MDYILFTLQIHRLRQNKYKTIFCIQKYHPIYNFSLSNSADRKLQNPVNKEYVLMKIKFSSDKI